MQTRYVLVLTGLAAVAGVWGTMLLSRPAHAAGGAWEYREVQLRANASSEPAFAKLGAEGWELVTVVAACEDGAYCQWWAYFKRPR
jgi:hypothetical protein